jgi:hypothetical protein
MRESIPESDGSSPTAPPSTHGVTAPAEEGLSRLLHLISGGDPGAFATFCDRTTRAVLGRLEEPPMHPAQVAEIFLTTYVEVWWLAGCYSGADTGVLPWLYQIVERRVAVSQRRRLDG